MITTIGELRKFLSTHDVSPEKLAPILKISNMTIRRLLERPDSESMPDRYEPHFERLDRLMTQPGGALPWEAAGENQAAKKHPARQLSS
ncbi:MAG: hypothetical protein ACXWPM_00345 [Bdellovibrionota bacterium]